MITPRDDEHKRILEHLEETGDYIVDTRYPPTPPPMRTIKSGWGGDFETKESINQTKKWQAYIKEYGRQQRAS